MDLSPLRKFEVMGPDAEQLLQRTVTRDILKLSTGQVVYTALCYDHGGMIDDATVLRLGPNNFRVVAGDDFTGIWLRRKAEDWGLKVFVKSSTDQLANLALQGPKSREVLAQVIWTPPHQPSITELKWFRFTIARLGHPSGPSVIVSRTGYTGGARLRGLVPSEGRDRGLRRHRRSRTAARARAARPRCPRHAADRGGLVFAHYDFDDGVDPFEAGIGFAVAASKDSDFVGREALLRRKANPSRKLVGLDLDGNETIGHGDPVFAGRAQVGVVTSATRSPILKKTIALARWTWPIPRPANGSRSARLDGHQKRLGAAVTAFPHFDPQKSRVRS